MVIGSIITGYLIYGSIKATDGALGKMGEDIYNYIKGKFPKLGNKILTARLNPKTADLQLMKKDLEDTTKKDQTLRELLADLGKELQNQDARIDNRKIVFGNENNQTYTAHTMHFGSGDNVTGDKIVNIHGEDRVKKNGY